MFPRLCWNLWMVVFFCRCCCCCCCCCRCCCCHCCSSSGYLMWLLQFYVFLVWCSCGCCCFCLWWWLPGPTYEIYEILKVAADWLNGGFWSKWPMLPTKTSPVWIPQRMEILGHTEGFRHAHPCLERFFSRGCCWRIEGVKVGDVHLMYAWLIGGSMAYLKYCIHAALASLADVATDWSRSSRQASPPKKIESSRDPNRTLPCPETNHFKFWKYVLSPGRRSEGPELKPQQTPHKNWSSPRHCRHHSNRWMFVVHHRCPIDAKDGIAWQCTLNCCHWNLLGLGFHVEGPWSLKLWAPQPLSFRRFVGHGGTAFEILINFGRKHGCCLLP